jgi:hypothetical protein
VLVWACRAHAQATNLRIEPVDNSAGGAALDGYVTTDLFIDFTGSYNGSQMLIELEQGTIYQDPLGGNIPPAIGVADLFPSSGFDTFVALGTPTLPGPFGQPNPFGGAINLFGEATLQFDEARINAAWTTQGGAIFSNQADFLSARVTLSEDARGTWSYFASSNGQWTAIATDGGVRTGMTPVVYEGHGVIEAGHLRIVIPEPSTVWLAIAAGLCCAARYLSRR